MSFLRRAFERGTVMIRAGAYLDSGCALRFASGGPFMHHGSAAWAKRSRQDRSCLPRIDSGRSHLDSKSRRRAIATTWVPDSAQTVHKDGRIIEGILRVDECSDDLPEAGRAHVETVPDHLFSDAFERVPG